MLTPRLALRLLRDPLNLGIELHGRYGNIVKVPVPIRSNLVSLASPEVVKELFTTPDTKVHAGEAMMETVGYPLVGSNSVLTLDEAPHIRERKLLLPKLHGKNLGHYNDSMHEIARREIESWPVGEPFSLLHYTDRIALAGILRTIFGINDEGRLERARRLSFEVTRRAYVVLIPNLLRRDLGGHGPWGRFVRARQAFDDFVYDEIRQRRSEADAEERDDMLSMLLNARRDDGSSMSDQAIRDELITLILTGQETAATAMAWAMERLLRTPRVLSKLRDSIAAGDEDYLNATVKETLRSRPVVPPFLRKLVSDIEIGGYTLTAGTYVLVAIDAIHQREDLFPNPQEFRPERFFDDKIEGYSWIPFGGGVRRCIGAAFVEQEMRITLRMIIERADLSAPDPQPEGIKIGTTFSPNKGARVVLNRPLRPARQASGAAVPA